MAGGIHTLYQLLASFQDSACEASELYPSIIRDLGVIKHLKQFPFSVVSFFPTKKNGRVFVDFVTSKFLEFSRSLQRSLAPLPWHRLHFTNGLFCFIPITWRIDKKNTRPEMVPKYPWRKNYGANVRFGMIKRNIYSIHVGLTAIISSSGRFCGPINSMTWVLGCWVTQKKGGVTFRFKPSWVVDSCCVEGKVVACNGLGLYFKERFHNKMDL